jgi:putative iron-regulated protein
VKRAWLLLLCLSCAPPPGRPTDRLLDAPPVIAQYVANARTAYAEAQAAAEAFDSELQDFLGAPSAEGLDGLRRAWLAARAPYSLTEVYRFSNGPIDNAQDGLEGAINAWPIDEAYVDYVVDRPDAGIINDKADFPMLTPLVLTRQNELAGEKNISTGYHVLEFLLWGQDFDPHGPGHRPYTDFVVGGTAKNQDRRATYLFWASRLLMEDLRSVSATWSLGDASYGALFEALPPREALTRMLTGMGTLLSSELAGERLAAPYRTKDQEEEQSCFSDNTLNDLYANALSVEDVYLGRHGAVDGPGLDDLVRARAPELDTRFRAELADALAAIQAIPAPFDQAILGDDAAPGRARILAAIRKLQQASETLVEIAALFGIEINLA